MRTAPTTPAPPAVIPVTPAGPGEDTQPQPDKFAARVIELFDAGNNITAICIQIFGYKNKARLEEIKQVLMDYGRIG